MEIVLPTCVIRPWTVTDAPALARHADDRRIWRNLRDAFPHPYALADAHAFIAKAKEMAPETFFAIVVDGVTRYAFAQHQHRRRVYAVPYAWSTASIRVLEKVGYRLEGRMRQSAV